MVHVVLGPLPSESARAWIAAARETIERLRSDPSLRVPAHVCDRFAVFVEEWAQLADIDPFMWSGDVDPGEIREIAAHWLRIARLAREQPETGLKPGPLEAEPFYDAVVLAMAEVVAVEDDQGFASKFEEEVPAFAPEPADTPMRGAGQEGASPRRVLLVDDTADIRMLIRFALEFDPRFEIHGEAEDGEQALVACQQSCPDVILLDIMMPVMDGFTALPLLRDQCPEAKVVVLSAVEEFGTRRRALELGASAFLTKMAGMDEIRSTLATVV